MSRKHKTAALFLSTALCLSSFTTVLAEQEETTMTFDEFSNPGTSSRPKTRWWVPGSHMTKDEITAEIESMATAGYGGIEVVPVADSGAEANNTDSIEWGTDSWNELTRHILETAKAHNMSVDFTMTPAWPLALPTIVDVDNPEEGAQMEADGAWVDGITAEKPFKGELPVNDEAIEDAARVNGTVTTVAVTVAKYADKENKVLDYASARSIHFDAATNTAQFIPEDDGEYVLFAWYQHPSGNQKFNNNQVDHYSKAGAQKIIDYWEQVILPAYGDAADAIESLFIDSLEFETQLDWTYGLLEGFKEQIGYDIAPYLAGIYDDGTASEFGSIGNYMGEPVPGFTFNKNSEQMKNQFYEYLTDLYITNHIEPLKAFANAHGYTLRYQTAYGKSLDLGKTALIPDIPETETLYGNDYLDFYRLQSGGVHLMDKNIYSLEGAAEWTETWNDKKEDGSWGTRGNGQQNSGNYQQTLEDLTWHYQRAFAGGVNQVVVHGYAYNGQFDGEGNKDGFIASTTWPGFEGFSKFQWSNSFGERQPNWMFAGTTLDFIGRNQYMLRQGTPKVDLAIYYKDYYEVIDFWGPDTKYDDDGQLQNAGYTYDFVGTDAFALENATVTNGLLAEAGPAYKAILVDQAHTMPLETLQRFLEYAENGLTIVFIGDLPAEDTFNFENNEKVQEVLEQLIKLDQVVQVESRDQVVAALENLHISPDAKVSDEPILSVHRQNKNQDIYYLYNYANAGKYEEARTGAAVDTEIELKGSGTPFIYNAWTGEVTPAAAYSKTDESVVIPVHLDANDSIFIVLDQQENGFDHVNKEENNVRYVEDELIYQSSASVNTEITSDNGNATIKLGNSQQPFTLKDWTLQVESWTKGEDPVTSQKTMLEPIELDSLVSWSDIEGLEHISGIGVYTASFKLDHGWESHGGAILNMPAITDSWQLKINDQIVPAKSSQGKLDIGQYVKDGTNTIEITVATTMLNALLYDNITNPDAHEDPRDYDHYGILGDIEVEPYSWQKLSEEPQLTTSDQDKQEKEIQPEEEKETLEEENTQNLESTSNSSLLLGILAAVAVIGGLFVFKNKKSSQTR